MANRVHLAEDTTAALMIEEMMLKTPGPAPSLPLEYFPRISGVSDICHGRHYLIPGQIFASPQPFAVSTIVGSGCALCLWDPSTGIGGVCQFVFPEGPEDDLDPGRYGNQAAGALLHRLLDLGADPDKVQCQALWRRAPQSDLREQPRVPGASQRQARDPLPERKGHSPGGERSWWNAGPQAGVPDRRRPGVVAATLT